MKDRILYIGLSGLAGSGKDTVAKALSVMLDNDFNTFEEFKEYYDTIHGYPVNMKFATFNKSVEEKRCICIAFADQLKEICSSMFGIPVERFYYNKANSWICINKDFSYTECCSICRIQWTRRNRSQGRRIRSCQRSCYSRQAVRL